MIEKHHIDDIEAAAAQLHQDRLVVFPTETVYGLGGNACSDRAVASIYEAKGRPQFNPLIVHVASLAQAAEHVVVDERAQRLAQAFWPGPLTLVLPRRVDCRLSLLVSAGLDSVAVRVPAHPLALALLERSGLPLAAPSANLSGRVSPTEAAHVHGEFGSKVAMVLDGGACEIGLESTVLDLTGRVPALLRHGKVLVPQIEALIGALGLPEGGIKSPGMLLKHYAPQRPLRMNASSVAESEALLAFGEPIKGAKQVLNLSVSGDLHEAAANLFRMIRALDKPHVAGIAVMTVPEQGLGIAINDRLRRACAGTVSDA